MSAGLRQLAEATKANARDWYVADEQIVVDPLTGVGAPNPDSAFIAAANPQAVLALLDERDALAAVHRDLVSRLGFGDNTTEPMADNDTVVAWFEERGREADEWCESQLWRNDCAEAGHPDGEDCWEHDPSLRLERAEKERDALAARVAATEALGAEWIGFDDSHFYGDAVLKALGAAGDDGCTFDTDGTCRMPEDVCSNAGECLWETSPAERAEDMRDQEDFDAREGRL